MPEVLLNLTGPLAEYNDLNKCKLRIQSQGLNSPENRSSVRELQSAYLCLQLTFAYLSVPTVDLCKHPSVKASVSHG